MKTSIILKAPIFTLLSLAFVETTCRRFYVLFFKTKQKQIKEAVKKGCRMLDFHEKASSGNAGSETPPSLPSRPY